MKKDSFQFEHCLAEYEAIFELVEQDAECPWRIENDHGGESAGGGSDAS
jgi:hypothetical protein